MEKNNKPVRVDTLKWGLKVIFGCGTMEVPVVRVVNDCGNVTLIDPVTARLD